jgi:hypothetical protein
MLETEHEQLVEKATALIRGLHRSSISPDTLCRQLGIPLAAAVKIVDHLVEAGVLGKREAGGYPILPTQPPPCGETPQPPLPTQASSATPPPPVNQPPLADTPDAAPAASVDTTLSGTVATTLPLDDIYTDATTQVRTRLDVRRVKGYAERMAAGDVFPPIVVFRVEGRYVVGDGFHRVAAARQCNINSVAAEIHHGSMRDAVLYALGANVKHGQPLTQKERREAVLRMLDDPEWREWSNEEIGRHCGVSGMTVSRHRPLAHPNNVKVTPRKCRDRNGGTRTMDVAGLGRKAKTKRSTESHDATPQTAQNTTTNVVAVVHLVLRHADQLLATPDSVREFARSESEDADRLLDTLGQLTQLLREAKTVPDQAMRLAA